MVSVDRYLERLNGLIDVEHVNEAERLQLAAQNFESVPRLPLILSSVDDMSKEGTPFTDWPRFSYEEAYRDMAKMLLNELNNVYEGVLMRDDKVYVIRANYGVGIIPSLFGCEIVQEGDRMPWVIPVESIDDIKAILRKGVPDMMEGLGSRVLETEEYFLEKLGNYDRLRETVHVGIPDNQGPFNLAAEIIGRAIFLELYDHPDLLHELLTLLTETYVEFTSFHKGIVGEEMDRNYYFQYILRGGVRIAEDHALGISPHMYEEFCQPYNIRAFQPFEGGTMLVCGEASHILGIVLETPGVRGVIYWSSNIDDLSDVYEEAAQRKIAVMWYGDVPEESLEEVSTGVIVKRQVKSLQEAEEIQRKFRRNYQSSF